MKKYKLIKEYPGSPELGVILTGNNENYRFHPTEKCMSNNPEFWEEVVEKDYEILSFISNQQISDIQKGTTLTKNGQNFECKRRLFLLDISSTEEKLLRNNMWDIYSVRRLSDGEIFTVGDSIKNNSYLKNHGNITRFFLKDENIFTEFYEGIHKLENVSHIKKLLFTTEDGVDIFEGDNLFLLNTNNWVIANISPAQSISSDLVREATEKKFKYFSTKEAAEDYVLMNHRSLSVNDVFILQTVVDSELIRSLKQVIKARL